MPSTILIVDDHPGFRSAARALLESEGYEVVGESGTGHEALRQAERLQPQVVLLDIGLPDIDGIEVAGRLSAAGEEAPAIVLTSSRDGAGCEHVFEGCGARGFIPKSELSGDAIAALA